MPRIRSVKPEIRRSLTVAEWPREVRLTWIYLWMYLDDEGRGLDDMRLVVAELYPLDRDVTERKMDRWLDLMATTKTSEHDVPPLCRYEVAGRRYLHAVNWQHQKINRPQPSRLPPCPIHDDSVNASPPHAVNGAVRESVNNSLPDSPPSRAPADQGSGNREHGSGKEGTTQGEHRNETLPASPATKHTQPSPADARCTAHQGDPAPPPCNGCRRERERAEAQLAREADRAQAARDNAIRACPDCHGTGWREHADGTPAGKCTHPRAKVPA